MSIPVRVLLVHNYYLQPGGEDTVFEAERDLLRRMGHQVITFTEHNARLNGLNPLKAAIQTIWSREAQRKLEYIIETTGPDLVHFHNTFLRISPAAYHLCSAHNLPVVQSLHNQRIFCPKATMYRAGRVCTDCVPKLLPWPAILHRCYHGSLPKTMVVATMVALHNWLRTWTTRINVYITFTKFFAKKFAEWGLPAEKIAVKPHFVYPDPGPKESYPGCYALYVGRLDPEKGVQTLVRAWTLLPHIPLLIRGDGSLLPSVNALATVSSHVNLVPRLPKPQLLELVKSARFLVWPSHGWYEQFGMVAIEAFACGVPIIASATGAMAEIVDHGRTGLLFEPGNPEDLAEKVNWAWNHPREMAEMGREARREFEAKYTAERNYEMLMAIYRRAMEQPVS